MEYTEFCRLIKNVTPEICKSRSLNTLTVWFICGTALLYVALFPPMDTMNHTGLPGVVSSFRYPPIPSLFPQELNSFDPFRVLMKIQQINQRFSLQPFQSADKPMSQSLRPPPEKPPMDLPKFKHEQSFQTIIAAASARYNVDTAMIKAIIRAESGYNPHALSPMGAGGLMQLMPLTAESMGVDDIFDPVQNINAGVKYFKMLMKLFKQDVSLALAAYNAGIQRVHEYNGIPPFSTTQIYIKKVLEYHQYYSNQARKEENPPLVHSEG
jgi:soluble lytic murein transglycosylase-like protein